MAFVVRKSLKTATVQMHRASGLCTLVQFLRDWAWAATCVLGVRVVLIDRLLMPI
jgi:hypothetical protein